MLFFSKCPTWIIVTIGALIPVIMSCAVVYASVLPAQEKTIVIGFRPELVAFGSAIVYFLTLALKTKLFGSVLKKLDPRWRMFIPICLSVFFFIGIYLMTGDFEQAMNGLFSGPVAIAIHETVSESMLNEYETRK